MHKGTGSEGTPLILKTALPVNGVSPPVTGHSIGT
jgi:hypothetical protein